ncbi:MAG: rhomboid family intramembrane serine protease [Bacteroidetes bacterium]|nr:MAG: rhomboid family intramembrane serine protease [Bacteroidota bacterium]
MSNIIEDLKNSFNRTGNGSGNEVIYAQITSFLFLPASFQEFIYKPWTILTYAISHEGFFHILFNMIFMYWFGMIITEFIGSKRFISLYILGALAGGVTFLLMFNTIPFFMNMPNVPLLGASGGVYAVVVGAAVLLPDYTFYLLFLGPVRIKYIAAFYVFLSFAESIGQNAGGNLAHLGGALMGFVFIWQLRKGNDLGKPFSWMATGVANLFKPSSKIKITYRNPNPKSSSVTNNSYSNSSDKEISQDELDAILDKISKYGYEKLTKEEKQKLFKASQSADI